MNNVFRCPVMHPDGGANDLAQACQALSNFVLVGEK